MYLSIENVVFPGTSCCIYTAYDFLFRSQIGEDNDNPFVRHTVRPYTFTIHTHIMCASTASTLTSPRAVAVANIHHFNANKY